MSRSIVTGFLLIVLFAFSGCDIATDEPGATDPDYVQQYLGTWHVTDTKARLNYDVTIARSGQSNTNIILNNFGDLGKPVYATVTEKNIVVTNQEVDEYSIEGSGTYESKKKLKFTYKFSDGIDEEMRNADFTR